MRWFRRHKAATPQPADPVAPSPISRPEAAARAMLLRDDVRPDVVRGTLVLKDETFHVLERPWLDNRRNESCIPAGEYLARFMPRSASGKYRNVYHLQDVPGRGGILIHSGNIVAHSKGCLIIGRRRGTLNGQPAVLNSKTALGELNDLMQGQDFMFKIVGDQIC